MKHYVMTLLIGLASTAMSAQTFEFGLQFMGVNDNTGNYEVALTATPDFTEENGNSADMGTVVSMSPDVYLLDSGFVNDCTNSGPPAFITTCEYPIEKEEWLARYLSGPSTASGKTVFSLERTETGESTFFDAVAGTPIILAVFQIYHTGSGNPTAGDITLVENDDPILASVFAESWLNIRYEGVSGSETINLYGGNDPSANAVYFSTLGTPEVRMGALSIHPNPAEDHVTIVGAGDSLERVEVFDLTGQLVIDTTRELETIDMSPYANGVYLVRLSTAKGSRTIKLIKDQSP